MLFFFQAEDGIRDRLVTGVQTCALPISEVALVDGADVVADRAVVAVAAPVGPQARRQVDAGGDLVGREAEVGEAHGLVVQIGRAHV